MSEDCKHGVQQWMPWENGYYRLTCVLCGKYLGQEAFEPSNTEPFEPNAWPFDYADEYMKRNWGR